MSNKTVFALNTVSGQVGVVPASYLDHPVLGKTLVEVPEGTKSYEPTKYKSQTADEWREDHPHGVEVEEKPARASRKKAAPKEPALFEHDDLTSDARNL
jgi:hypothetical protein